MEDAEIIELYFARSEDAVGETARKYGAYCHRIAHNILQRREDAEECVNDTYLAAWNAMPPERPSCLRAFLGRITRNLSIARYRRDHAQKRHYGTDALLSELDECLPSPDRTEAAVERAELTDAIVAWLEGLNADDRALFLRRYWYGDAVSALAAECGVGANRMAQRLRRLRGKLRDALEKGGHFL